MITLTERGGCSGKIFITLESFWDDASSFVSIKDKEKFRKVFEKKFVAFDEMLNLASLKWKIIFTNYYRKSLSIIESFNREIYFETLKED